MSISKNISLIEGLENLGMNNESYGLRWVSDKENEKGEEHIYLALEQAERFNAKAVYFRFFSEDIHPPRPQIYIYEYSEINLAQNTPAQIHHHLWNAGVVPYAFIFSESEVLVYNCGLKPDWNKEDSQFTTKAHDVIDLLYDVQSKIEQYHARQFDSGLFWDSSVGNNLKYGQSAYEQLLNELKNAKSNIISQVGHDKALLVKRVLMMLILIKYLEDRKDENGSGALNPKEFYKDYIQSDPTLEGVLKNVETFSNMLKDLSSKEHFNGQIFYLSQEERIELSRIDLRVFQLFVRGDAAIFQSSKHGLGNLSLWKLYQFNYLPIELISHIYEDFLADENGNKKKGVVYTPPYLVQFLVDRTMPLNTPKEDFKVLDPACGSGIFLVGAYKRMIQWWRIRNNWKKPTRENIDELKALLKNNIYGCDLEEEAVTLTYFSLGLALLDALSPKEIWKNVHFDNLIDHNLISGDFFKTLFENKLGAHFDLVIGNPPFEERFTDWATLVDDKSKSEDAERPDVPQKQVALLFLEQSFKLLKEGGNTCLILPAGPVLYNTKVHNFRSYLIETNRFKTIFDFTPLRAKLFIGSSSSAKPAVVAVLAENNAHEEQPIQHLVFRRTRASSEKIEFEIDHYDFHWVSFQRALSISRVWQANFMGGGRLHNLMEKLSSISSLQTYLEDKVENHNWKVAEGWIESASSRYIQRTNTLSLLDVYNEKEKQEFEKLKAKYEAKWLTGHPFVETDDFTEKGILKTRACEIKYFYRSAKTNKEIFEPPHILVKESVVGEKIAVHYSDKYLTFKDQIFGIHAPKGSENKLKQLKKNLGNKYNVALMWLSSAKMITSREGVANKIDILSLPYSEENLTINPIEEVLLDDISKHYSDFRKQGEKSEILNTANSNDLELFGKMYCKILNSIYDDLKPLDPVLGNDFIAYPFILGDQPEIEIPDTISGIESKLHKLLDHQVSYNLWVKRILRVYHKNVIILYKPNQKRYWLRSIAVRDADETFSDLYNQGK
ncbi:N-6 DNA methylase [Algoriphagus aquimarinus]|uniref:HsdM family class I SAM-dependent methyltransferase n=1 Tax=Algoriphagus aquimarinus TaxID=237018 RepID=UPI0030DBCA3D|tara:strand:- start:4656 stop:7676 length:3021 start_codon:yes stop_codon:yes gene_type:complete